MSKTKRCMCSLFVGRTEFGRKKWKQPVLPTRSSGHHLASKDNNSSSVRHDLVE